MGNTKMISLENEESIGEADSRAKPAASGAECRLGLGILLSALERSDKINDS
jgi:hypothetical protein